jgi:acyl-coenzyme A thioesterase PaaI-like protein
MSTQVTASAVRGSIAVERLADVVRAFNQRREVQWFGLEGGFANEAEAWVRFARRDSGFLGGGGRAALNGGVIAAGFDAVCVLAALGQYPQAVVATTSLQLQFLRLAKVVDDRPLPEYRATVVKAGRHLCFVHASLWAEQDLCASATATLAPVAR